MEKRFRHMRELFLSNLSSYSNSSAKDDMGRGGGAQINNSTSLYNLMDPGAGTTSAGEIQFYNNQQQGQLVNKSISMYGISTISTTKNYDYDQLKRHSKSSTSTPATNNPALKLFYSLRSKLRKQRRRKSIVAAKTSDFGPYLNNYEDNPTSQGPANSRSYSYPSENIEHFGPPIAGTAANVQSNRNCNVISAENEDINQYLGARKLSRKSDGEMVVLVNQKQSSVESLSDDCDNQPQLQPQQIIVTNTNTNPGENDDIHHGHTSSTISNISSIDIDTSSTTSSSTRPQLDNSSINTNTLSLSNYMNASPSPSSSTSPKRCLTSELQDLLHNNGWYWGSLCKKEAEFKLRGQPNGYFLVRDSSSDHYLLSLSFNSNSRTLHTRIEHRNGQFCFYSSEADSFPTVAELIENCILNSESGVFCYSKARRSDATRCYPVRLTKPISRFTQIKSLLYMCRFEIRQLCRVDQLQLLPLPPSLIDYISEKKYMN